MVEMVVSLRDLERWTGRIIERSRKLKNRNPSDLQSKSGEETRPRLTNTRSASEGENNYWSQEQCGRIFCDIAK